MIAMNNTREKFKAKQDVEDKRCGDGIGPLIRFSVKAVDQAIADQLAETHPDLQYVVDNSKEGIAARAACYGDAMMEMDGVKPPLMFDSVTGYDADSEKPDESGALIHHDLVTQMKASGAQYQDDGNRHGKVYHLKCLGCETQHIMNVVLNKPGLVLRTCKTCGCVMVLGGLPDDPRFRLETGKMFYPEIGQEIEVYIKDGDYYARTTNVGGDGSTARGITPGVAIQKLVETANERKKHDQTYLLKDQMERQFKRDGEMLGNEMERIAAGIPHEIDGIPKSPAKDVVDPNWSHCARCNIEMDERKRGGPHYGHMICPICDLLMFPGRMPVKAALATSGPGILLTKESESAMAADPDVQAAFDNAMPPVREYLDKSLMDGLARKLEIPWSGPGTNPADITIANLSNDSLTRLAKEGLQFMGWIGDAEILVKANTPMVFMRDHDQIKLKNVKGNLFLLDINQPGVLAIVGDTIQDPPRPGCDIRWDIVKVDPGMPLEEYPGLFKSDDVKGAHRIPQDVIDGIVRKAALQKAEEMEEHAKTEFMVQLPQYLADLARVVKFLRCHAIRQEHMINIPKVPQIPSLKIKSCLFDINAVFHDHPPSDEDDVLPKYKAPLHHAGMPSLKDHVVRFVPQSERIGMDAMKAEMVEDACSRLPHQMPEVERRLDFLEARHNEYLAEPTKNRELINQLLQQAVTYGVFNPWKDKITEIMNALGPAMDQLNREFCKNEKGMSNEHVKNAFKRDVLERLNALETTEKGWISTYKDLRDQVNLRRIRSGIELEGVEKRLVALEGAIGPDFDGEHLTKKLANLQTDFDKVAAIHRKELDVLRAHSERIDNMNRIRFQMLESAVNALTARANPADPDIVKADDHSCGCDCQCKTDEVAAAGIESKAVPVAPPTTRKPPRRHVEPARPTTTMMDPEGLSEGTPAPETEGNANV
jgi:hypothetical protein